MAMKMFEYLAYHKMINEQARNYVHTYSKLLSFVLLENSFDLVTVLCCHRHPPRTCIEALSTVCMAYRGSFDYPCPLT